MAEPLLSEKAALYCKNLGCHRGSLVFFESILPSLELVLWYSMLQGSCPRGVLAQRYCFAERMDFRHTVQNALEQLWIQIGFLPCYHWLHSDGTTTTVLSRGPYQGLDQAFNFAELIFLSNLLGKGRGESSLWTDEHAFIEYTKLNFTWIWSASSTDNRVHTV